MTRERGQIEAFLVLRRNPLELWGSRAYREDILDGRFLGKTQLLVNDADAIRHILVGNPQNYARNVGTRRILRPIIGEGLFLADGAAWKHQRRTIAPAMTPRSTGVLARHVIAATVAREAVLDRLTHRPIELLGHLQHLALAIAGQSMFSLEMAAHGGQLRALLMRYAMQCAKVGVLDIALPASIDTPADRKRAVFRREWLAFVGGLIDARMEQGVDAEAPRDLFDMLASARDPETGVGFSRDQLCDEVATMIVAGHETTAVTLFWAMYLAARYPAFQDRMAAEADGADLDEDAAAGAVAGLVSIRAHVDEALRLYPPAFLLVRQAIGADEIGGRTVAPGTVISISPWVLHRHHRYWREPDAYDPGRFLPGAVAPERFGYLPFGAGPRVCVGAQFALTEAVLVMARLLRRFRVGLAGPDRVAPRGFVTTQPDRPVWFVLTPR